MERKKNLKLKINSMTQVASVYNDSISRHPKVSPPKHKRKQVKGTIEIWSPN